MLDYYVRMEGSNEGRHRVAILFRSIPALYCKKTNIKGKDNLYENWPLGTIVSDD